MRKTMMSAEQGDRQQTQEEMLLRSTILRYSASALLLLGILMLHAGPAQALPPDHRSTDGTCGGKAEPPNPAGTPCDVKLCTNDGDWMCCKRCTASGGYCCDQIVSS